jgi:hypothetical protein
MEEGCQKSKRLSYTAKLKHEVIQCTEEKGKSKATAILELMKAMFDCGGNTRQQSVGVRRHEGNSLDPRKDDFLKSMMQSSRFFKINYCIVLFLWHIQQLYHFSKIQLSTANAIRMRL